MPETKDFKEAGKAAAKEASDFLDKVAEDRGPAFAAKLHLMNQMSAASGMVSTALRSGNVPPHIQVMTHVGLAKVFTNVGAHMLSDMSEQDIKDLLEMNKGLTKLLGSHIPQEPSDAPAADGDEKKVVH